MARLLPLSIGGVSAKIWKILTCLPRSFKDGEGAWISFKTK
jgi:hypothetical protein